MYVIVKSSPDSRGDGSFENVGLNGTGDTRADASRWVTPVFLV